MEYYRSNYNSLAHVFSLKLRTACVEIRRRERGKIVIVSCRHYYYTYNKHFSLLSPLAIRRVFKQCIRAEVLFSPVFATSSRG